MPAIHPSAVIDPRAHLAEDVKIGPFCIIESDVHIARGCRLAARVSVKRGTVLGEDNHVAEGAVLGGRPQHLRAGEALGRLVIGRGNQIRENATIHRGLTAGEDTVVGDANFIMVNAHIAHDCRLGNHVIVANNSMLSGHVTVEDRAYISGAVGVHQFCRIGSLAMVGGQAHINRDVPPFVTVDGESSLIVGLNIIGLRRAGFSQDELAQLKSAYRLIYRSGLPWTEILEALKAEFASAPAARFHAFFTSGKRGFVPARQTTRVATLKLRRDDQPPPPGALRKAG